MYFYKIKLSNNTTYIVKSKKTNVELLNLIAKNDWSDYLLAEPIVMPEVNQRIENNVVAIKSSEIVSIEYYVENTKFM